MLMKKKGVCIVICVLILNIIPFPGNAADPIKFAAIFAKSGDGQMDNWYNFEGIRLAVEEINAQGGVLGRQLEVIEINNKSTPLGSKVAALQAAQLGVTAVIGASWSSHSLAMAPVLQLAEIPMISTVSTHPAVTQIGNYIFRICFIDSFQGAVMAQFAHNDLNAQTAVILTNMNNDYSMGLSRHFEEAFLQHGGKILWNGKYLERALDFTTLLEKVRTLQPDVIFAPDNERNGSLLIKQAVNIGIQTTFLGGDGWSAMMYQLAGKAIEGHYFSNHWHPDVPFPQSQHIQETYHRKHGDSLIIADLPLAYDAVFLLADAIVRAQSLNPVDIRDALSVTQNFQGATGNISFDAHGDPLNKNAVILQFHQNDIRFIKTIQP